MTTRYFLPLALFALAPAPGRQDLSGLPPEGLSLRTSFEYTSERELDDIVATMNGEQRDMDQQRSSSKTRKLVLLDEYLGLDEDRVTKFRRTYEEVELSREGSTSLGGQQRDFTSTASSDLLDETVEFEWDEDDEEYVVSAEDVDDELLEELTIQPDFRVLLPDGEVDEDDEWSIDGELFLPLLRSQEGIPVDWQTDGEDAPEPDDDQPEPETEIAYGGEIMATFLGMREVDDVELAVIRLEGEVSIDQTASFERDMEHGSSSVETESTTTLSVSGECLWNAAGGYLHSLEIAGEIEVISASESTFSFGEREFTTEQEMSESGELECAISVEVVE